MEKQTFNPTKLLSHSLFATTEEKKQLIQTVMECDKIKSDQFIEDDDIHIDFETGEEIPQITEYYYDEDLHIDFETGEEIKY